MQIAEERSYACASFGVSAQHRLLTDLRILKFKPVRQGKHGKSTSGVRGVGMPEPAKERRRGLLDIVLDSPFPPRALFPRQVCLSEEQFPIFGTQHPLRQNGLIPKNELNQRTK